MFTLRPAALAAATLLAAPATLAAQRAAPIPGSGTLNDAVSHQPSLVGTDG